MSDRFEYDRLLAERAQEGQMKEMLEQSCAELESTIADLDRRFESMDDESNEWKTRYESQSEMNNQLERQILRLQEKIDEHSRTLSDKDKKVRLPKSVRVYEDPAEVTSYQLKQMEVDKKAISGQLRDMEWKLDQESKAYHQANEQRKQCLTELGATKSQIDHLKNNQRMALMSQRENESVTPRTGGSNEGMSVYGNTNIAEDQRVIDPRRGPIKRTAATKQLPRLDT